jgi:hypothetical protein
MTLSKTFFIKCHYAECGCAEYRNFCIVMLNVIMLSVVMLNVVAPRYHHYQLNNTL